MSVSRREFLALLGTSIAGTAAVAVAGANSAGSATPSAEPADAGWIVDQIGAVSKGAVPITLRRASTGEVLRVDACRRGLAANPVASSRQFDLFLANDGRGNAPSPRHHVAAAQGLAAHLDRKIVASLPAAVLTMQQRQAVHAELHTSSDDLRS